MLDSGVGLPVGYSKGLSPASFIYSNRKDGLCVGYNDGARVSAAEAKQMAFIARLVAEHEDRLFAEWSRLTDDEKQRRADRTDRLYTQPARRDFVEKARAFADWAEKSGGFRVW